ncbi:LPD7 domain-containing protein [Methylotenera sp.]|uniref:LPD7 domain-containing protein n=1 Tax=Methylotenera sp. TaxID=2051956 RepID=UPI0024890733|nr:LPD7 domain-containing protein [Methylotenera sp.]MDI1298616.1 hypothetical protein [Methylotenera sp.]
MATEKTNNQRAYQGVVLAHGEAKYNFDENEKKSYYIKMVTSSGEQTVWGVDLNRAASEAELKAGDPIKLENTGMKAVQVDALKKDELGKILGIEKIDTNRNSWTITPIELQADQKVEIQQELALGNTEAIKEKVAASTERVYHIGTENDSVTYKDATEAGNAFYDSDVTKLPFVLETAEKGGSKLIASSELKQDGDAQVYNKKFNSPEEVDANFVYGYFEAMQKSTDERLKTTDWQSIRDTQTIDPTLNNDLETLSQVDVRQASQMWAKHAPKDIPTPPYIIPDIEKHTTLSDNDLSRLSYQRATDRASANAALESQQIPDAKKDTSQPTASKDEEKRKRFGLDNLLDLIPKGKELKKEEIIMPPAIKNKYLEVDGKFYSKDNDRVLVFQDKGDKLATSTDDKKSVQDMIEYAKAKQWQSLSLTGSKEFRREAWLQAESQGIKTKGYTPNEVDMTQLKELSQTRATNTITQVKSNDLNTPLFAERHNINKNQSVMHESATKSVTSNIQALQAKDAAFAQRSIDDMTKIAYWRGVVMEENKNKPFSQREEALDRYDSQAKSPDFIKRIDEQTQGTIDDKTIERTNIKEQQHDEHTR